MGYEVAFYFRYPGTYTIEVVLEQGDAFPVSKYPRTRAEYEGNLEPVYEGWILPGFPLEVDVMNEPATTSTAAPLTRQKHQSATDIALPWCTMEQLEESHPADQWLVSGSIAVAPNDGHHAAHHEGSNERYQMGYASLGICTEFTKANCSLLPTSSILWDPTSEAEKRDGNILAQCMRHKSRRESEGAGTKPLNIIVVGDSVVKYNVSFRHNLFSVDPCYVLTLVNN